MADANCQSPLINSYARLPVTFKRGAGARLWDADDNEYLDALGGIAVCALGHGHPGVTEAISQQAQTLLHTSNLFGIEQQENLAAKLCELTGMEAVFFCNSGAEANEAAIKISRLFARRQSITAPQVITFDGSFHGRTMATLSATGNAKVHDGFAPLVDGFVHLPYNDLSAIENAAAKHQNIVAVLVEPILGEGGIVVPDADYLAGIRKLCDANNWLFMADEIQTGVGRTGEWYASQHLKPDVITSAKALGNGIPIGACLTRGIAAELIQPGHHGTTFGGNPFATRVGLAVLQAMEEENLPAKAHAGGERLKRKLTEALHNRPELVEIRGEGMMIGIQLDLDCANLVKAGLANQVIFNVTAGNVLRLLPPYILSDEEIDEIATRVVKSIDDVCEQQRTHAGQTPS